MDYSDQPDPKPVSPSDPSRLLLEDEVSKAEDDAKNELEFEAEAGPLLPDTSSFSSLSVTAGVEVPDDDNDGFRTPENHRIPVITECPPAPKKTRMPLRIRRAINSPKRAGSHSRSKKRIQIKLSEEAFDALFQIKIKKATAGGAV